MQVLDDAEEPAIDAERRDEGEIGEQKAGEVVEGGAFGENHAEEVERAGVGVERELFGHRFDGLRGDATQIEVDGEVVSLHPEEQIDVLGELLALPERVQRESVGLRQALQAVPDLHVHQTAGLAEGERGQQAELIDGEDGCAAGRGERGLQWKREREEKPRRERRRAVCRER